MIKEFLKSMILIFMAEMGDKTQILAMAFATQFMVKEVLLGVFFGSLLNHGLAVILGAYLSSFIPLNAIQIIAGFLFIGFALWTLKADEDDEDDEVKRNFGPVLTVAVAFFIGELGDKTQLTAITLASDAAFPAFILLGTVSGMVLTSGVGIIIGSKIGNRIPEFTMKIASASIFTLFGVIKLYTAVPRNYLTPINTGIFFGLLSISIYFALRPLLQVRKYNKSTALKEVALTLYEYTHQIKESVEEICLGEGTCGKCQGKNCVIGYTKRIIDDAIENKTRNYEENFTAFTESLSKNFDKEKVINSLSMILVCPINYKDQESGRNQAINKARQMLEYVLFNERLKYDGNREEYFNELIKIDKVLANKVIAGVEKLIA
ncbi:TMEM165/GDT1 family protein [Wukongibacter baidiensis]|uniref:TMEM165/GDT1 family protein n=1 Tax=Wukongibacter baidiensis TaxID=1723361 RepID=UPI003D7FCDA4